MHIKDIKKYIHDSMCIYKEIGVLEHEIIFSGFSANIPKNVLNMRVMSIGATENGIVDIRVE